jgi:hypothetical protein
VRLRPTLLPLLLLAPLACGHVQPTDLADASGPGTASMPLTGTARRQHVRQMQRALEALFVFRSSVDSLAVRREPRNREVFGDFVEAYMGLQVDALLRDRRHRGQPELVALDANLRIAKADLLIRMHERGRADAVLADATERFRGNERMLIEYPPGKQTTVGKALELLRHKRRWGL